jgi:RNA polymerase subunit RPABC4/transcription elongation factor Spt4
MGDILKTIGDTIGAIFENPILQFGLRAVAIYIVILWLAAAYWAFRDIQLRTENPIAPYLVASMVILFTPVFFALAVFIYRIVRPQERIGEVYERNLAEEALLAEVDAIKSCPNCNRRVDEEWIICPTCRTRLNRVCPNCGRLVGLDWTLCAWCGRDFDRREVAAAVRSVPALGDVEVEAPPPAVLRPGARQAQLPHATPTAAARQAAPEPQPEH